MRSPGTLKPERTEIYMPLVSAQSVYHLDPDFYDALAGTGGDGAIRPPSPGSGGNHVGLRLCPRLAENFL